MDFELKNLKGTFDFLPEEQVIRNKLIDILRSTFELYGYLPLETPIICYYDLLSSKYAGGAEILKEVYKVADQGNRELGLRYDLTVPFSKVLGLMKEPTLPFKRYEIGKVFRDGPVKVGRNREFYQIDVDVCGISSMLAEVELFSMALRAYKNLGIDICIHYNNRKVLTGLITECNIKNVNETILIVDKLEKISKEEIYGELSKLGATKEEIDKLYSFFSLSLNDLFNLETTNQNLKEGILEIKELFDYLVKLKISDKCIFKANLARGLDIYTGTVWEVFDNKKRITSSLGGGGRYDEIITKFINNGNVYPAVGMSFGLEPIYAILANENNFKSSLYDVYLYAFNVDAKVIEIAEKLRENNIKVYLEMTDKKLKKAMNFASNRAIPYVLIVGEEELQSNLYSLKNMETGVQEKLNIEEVVKKIYENKI